VRPFLSSDPQGINCILKRADENTEMQLAGSEILLYECESYFRQLLVERKRKQGLSSWIFELQEESAMRVTLNAKKTKQNN